MVREILTLRHDRKELPIEPFDEFNSIDRMVRWSR